jgi:hypothetical protein
LSGVNQASENLGKGPDATTIAFSMYLSRRHPKSAEQMALQFGLKKKAFQQYASTPEGAEVVANLNLALKHGNGYAASRFAGQLLKNNPSLFTGLEQQAGIHDLLRGSPEMEDIARAAIEHTELGTSIGAHAGAAQGSLPSMGYAPGVPPQYLDFIAQIAKEKGVPLNEALALFATESGFRNVKNPNSSARGIGQITSGTAALYGYTAADMSAPDQKKNIIAAISYYAAARQQSKGNAIRARDYYHFGLGSNQTDAADETTFANYANQYSEMNNVLSTQTTNAQQSTTQLTGSAIADKEVQSVSDAVQVAFRGVADAAHEVSQALHEAASAARDYTGTAKAPGGGYFSGGQYVPPAAVPHQQTVK